MTDKTDNGADETAGGEKDAAQTPAPIPLPQKSLLRLPGVVAISLYLLALAAVIIFGVVSGAHYPPLYLFFSAAFITASGGLLMFFRWAWALALAAVLLLVVYNLWIFSSLHQGVALVQGLLNLVFFLYLVRPEVRERLR
jgi:glycerol-3-phosphate acyltransferase PlsY